MQRRDDDPTLVPLFDAVAADPDDDAPRQVLADALLERGDLRGEFIALQLLRARKAATPAQEAREAHHRLDGLTLELATTGVKLILRGGGLTISFENGFWLGQRTPALRNLAAQFAPFPFPRVHVEVGGVPATREELRQLGDAFVTWGS